jgi:hypothetical protein
VNVETIDISALSVQIDKTISSSFVAKTFVYVEPAEEKPAEKAAAKPGGEAK